MAIATCILKAEAESSIGYKDGTSAFSGDRSNTQVRPDQSWLGALVKLLTAGQNFEAFCVSLSSIQFICFNYDRCIERYLHSVIPLLYPPKEFDEAELDASLEIIRPYGSLGMLSADTNKELPFGKFSDTKYVLQASGQIRTFTEGMDTDVRTRIGNAFSEASRVVFLGYGYIATNDGFLFDEGPFEIRAIFGTVLGLSEERIEHVAQKIRSGCMMAESPHGEKFQVGILQLKPEGCSDLIYRFSHIFESMGR